MDLTSLPSKFRQRMQRLLGSEGMDFLSSLQAPSTTGLRVNTLKISEQDLAHRLEWEHTRVPWCEEGWVLPESASGSGLHPYHAAGLYYLQDPSAMAAAILLDPQPGDWVLDMAAAPGGKATHIAARMQGEGVLVANDVERWRTHSLIENLERCGITNALVVNESPVTLASIWPQQFDRVLVDAPCSGEGMFRKNEAARQAWRPETVSGCALRQSHILDSAAALVRPGGRLVYATCTFAPEENEENIADFLRRHPHYQLLAPPQYHGFDRGRPEWVPAVKARNLPLQNCVRIWPHRAPGEGHFYAVMQRHGEAPPRPVLAMPAGDPPPHELVSLWQKTMKIVLPLAGWVRYGDWLHRIPVPETFWSGLRPRRAGLRVGQTRHSLLLPHHAFALTLDQDQVQLGLMLQLNDSRIASYLKGETLLVGLDDGWTLVTVDGYGLGWGKMVQGTLKNHYPKALRSRT